jgi:alkylated DNA nucleotide flippase Atl1
VFEVYGDIPQIPNRKIFHRAIKAYLLEDPAIAKLYPCSNCLTQKISMALKRIDIRAVNIQLPNGKTTKGYTLTAPPEKSDIAWHRFLNYYQGIAFDERSVRQQIEKFNSEQTDENKLDVEYTIYRLKRAVGLL